MPRRKKHMHFDYKTETATKTKELVSVSVSVVVMMLASLSLAVGFVVGFSFKTLTPPSSTTTTTATDEFKDSGPALFVQGELLVKYRADVSEEEKNSVFTQLDDSSIIMKNRAKAFNIPELEQGVETTDSAIGSPLKQWEVVTFSQDLEEDQLAERILQDPRVEYAEPNYILKANWVPNDTYVSTSGSWGQPYKDLWGFYSINADKAWDVVYPFPKRCDLNNDSKLTSADVIVFTNYLNGTVPAPTPAGNGDCNADGATNAKDRDYLNAHIFQSGPSPVTYNPNETHKVIVAVIDSGVDTTHPDIDANLWVNEDEIDGDFIDNDDNGYLDDRQGWNFVQCEEYDAWGINCTKLVAQNKNVTDTFGHGTHVAGTIAAEMNNAQGIAGVCPHCTIMPLRVMNKTGYGELKFFAQAIQYAADNGADVVNMSWGGQGDSGILHEALKYADKKGVTLIASAGNENIDASLQMPSRYPEVISVASLDQNNVKTSFSNWGKIEIAAPGGGSHKVNNTFEAQPRPSMNILSLRAKNTDISRNGLGIVGTNYMRAWGTSMAAPHVAGVAALILSRHPEYSNTQVRGLLMQTATDLTHSAYSCSPYTSQTTCHAASITCQWIKDACSSWDVSYGSGYDIFLGSGKVDAFAAISANKPLELSLDSLPVSVDSSFMRTDKPIQINGTARGELFTQYIVDVSSASNPTEWTEISRSSTPVSGGLLATWNVNGNNFGKYNIRVRVISTNGSTVEQQMQLYVGLKPRFPMKTFGFSEPSYLDINAKFAGPEIVARDQNFIRGYYSNGTEFKINDSIQSGSILSIGDVEHDGKYEVFVTQGNVIKAYETQDYNLNGVFDAKPGWPVTMSQVDSSMVVFPPVIPPVLADIDNDGIQEIIVGHQSGFTTVFRADGSSFGGSWPVELPTDKGKVNVNPIAAGNLDGDSELEIAAATNDSVYVFNHDGSTVSGWPKTLDATYPKMLISDLTNDGTQELIIATSTKLLAFRGDGSQLFSFSPPENAKQIDIKNFPVAGEIDSQVPGKEIVVSFAIPVADKYSMKMYLVSASGTLLNNGNSILAFPASFESYTSPPILADINGNGEQEIFVMKGDLVQGILKNGARIDGNWPLTMYKIVNRDSQSSPGIIDFDNDGKIEIIVEKGGYLQVYQTNYSTGTSAWPMFMHDPQRTGNSNP